MGLMFDKLLFKEELKEWIRTYAPYSNINTDEDEASLEELMRFWEEAKAQKLYKMFGEEFILEKEITFERSVDELEEKMFQSRDMLNFVQNFRYWIADNYKYPDIIATRLYNLCNWTVLADNRYDGRNFKIIVNGVTISIQNGCKPSKILGKIANAADIEGFEKFRIAQSMILDKKKTKGTLCFSIHPLDYLTMSDNEYDWESCMNWRNGGCYRMGTVEMMNSPCVVVVYLKGDKTMRYFDYEWNSKKWRNLFIIDADCIIGIKGYPYQSEELDKAALKELKILAENNLGYYYGDKIFEHRFYENSETVEIDNCHEVDFNLEANYMYNDFGNSNTTHFILNPDVIDDGNVIDINYSGVPECMYSGHIIDGWTYEINDADEVICNKYMDFKECICCGDRLGDDWYELDGDYYCEDCYFNHRVFDPFEGEYHHDDNMHPIYMIPSKEELEAGLKEKNANWLYHCPKVLVNDETFLKTYGGKNYKVYSGECQDGYYNYVDIEYKIYFRYVIQSELSPEVIRIIEDYNNGYYD